MLGMGLELRLGDREHLKTSALTIGGDPMPNYRGKGLTELIVKGPQTAWLWGHAHCHSH